MIELVVFLGWFLLCGVFAYIGMYTEFVVPVVWALLPTITYGAASTIILMAVVRRREMIERKNWILFIKELDALALNKAIVGMARSTRAAFDDEAKLCSMKDEYKTDMHRSYVRQAKRRSKVHKRRFWYLHNFLEYYRSCKLPKTIHECAEMSH